MRIAVLDDSHSLAAAHCDWGDLAPGVTIFRDPIPEAERARTLAPFEVLCIMRERTPLPGALIDALPNLRLIVTSGVRNASVDMQAAAARDITVCGTPSRPDGTAQLAMLLILTALRRMGPEMTALHSGGWQAAEVGRDATGLTLGLIGLGKQGGALAALARPFGMRLIGWSANLTEARCAELGVERMDSLAALLAEADVASVHLVLSGRSRGLIGAAELALMKRDAVLVNTARAPIVDETALLAALRAGTGPGMAALDVFEAEPLPQDSPLRDADLIAAGKLVMTPHIGYASAQNYALMYRETSAAVHAWLAGAPIRVIT